MKVEQEEKKEKGGRWWLWNVEWGREGGSMYKAEQWEAERRKWREQFSLWRKPSCLWKGLCFPFFIALLPLLPFLLAPYHCFVVLSAEKKWRETTASFAGHCIVKVKIWKNEREKGPGFVYCVTRSVKRK